ncbi:hypothetical protein EJ03DRAFT_28904 [Teratosphaeria nubilosa]|uniref:Uncharacterized protein n=1 Tax=Teratosphaeria nubilosa TaxID=161662 RepID=A0A6G1LFN8_9PEZI|nr:hypothetical protein EJ03DRAFT_28904 [Teratosphaeria nubilosa]
MSKSTKRAKQTSNNTKPSPSAIPTPFNKAPPALEPFLDQLDPKQVYITHVDRHPIETKKQIFLIPVLLNGTIALLLLWRVYAALPTYWAIFQALLGYTSSATVDLEHTTRNDQIMVLLKRTGMFAMDFLIFRFVGPWPLTFFAEQPANPVIWRWNLGFHREEAVVRVSRNWGADDLMKGLKQGEENPFFKTRILPAIEREHMKKTGYLMQDGSWDLDFQSMLDAHTLAKQSRLQLRDLDKRVLVFMGGEGWLSWQWETDNDVIEDRRKKVVQFKDMLTKMGKESLFWRWMEIVEEERDRDGGFSAEGQQKVAERVQAAFTKEGVDFEELERSVGGLNQLPTQK